MCEMAYLNVRFVFSVIFLCYINSCVTQQYVFRHYQTTTPLPLPFPACRADDIDCLRRGIRTFFILMDSGHYGMKPIDPVLLNSVAVSLPEQRVSFLLRNVNVTGAKWTKLHDRRFNLEGGRSSVVFINDFHVTGEIRLQTAEKISPFSAYMTMDIQNVETNISYAVEGQKRTDNEDYIIIKQERIIPRNSRLPTFFLQPNTEESYALEELLQFKPSIVDHLSDEITTAVMHLVVDNFKLFTSKVPVRHYYTYY